MLLFLLVLSTVVSFTLTEGDGCILRVHGRGVGKVPSDCRDKEKNGALCYPYCKDDYKGVGPVCWQSCPSGFTDIGVGCQKPKPYGRGAGYPLWDKKKCEHAHPDVGCEKWGALWYPKCRENYHHVACCICSPDCPNGMTDSGVDCTKHSYGRGAGTVPHCNSDQENLAGLCYKNCREGYAHVGLLCWQQQCPQDLKKCGFTCFPEDENCGSELAKATFEVMTEAIEALGGFFDGEIPMAILDVAGAAIHIAEYMPKHLCN